MRILTLFFATKAQEFHNRVATYRPAHRIISRASLNCKLLRSIMRMQRVVSWIPQPDRKPQQSAVLSQRDIEAMLTLELMFLIFDAPQIRCVGVRNLSDTKPSTYTCALAAAGGVRRPGTTHVSCCDSSALQLGWLSLLHGSGIHLIADSDINAWTQKIVAASRERIATAV
jgi:hypothetical protein